MKYEVRLITDSVKTVMGEPRVAGCVHQITIINKDSEPAAKREATRLHPEAKGSWEQDTNYDGDPIPVWCKTSSGYELWLTQERTI